MKEQYGSIQGKQLEFLIINLCRVKHTDEHNLVTSLDSFGPGYFSNNVAKMQEKYSHPKSGETISLREPTTSESVSRIAYNFTKDSKPKVLDPRWAQMGRIVRASEGVYINPPKDSTGNPIKDERILKLLLNGTKKSNGIYTIEDKIISLEDLNYDLRDFSFVPYGSFEQRDQSSGDFARSGLARGLEHTTLDKAEKLEAISSKDNYPNGVYVGDFDSLKEPQFKISGLDSVGGRLDVGGSWDGGSGHAFGVYALEKRK